MENECSLLSLFSTFRPLTPSPGKIKLAPPKPPFVGCLGDPSQGKKCWRSGGSNKAERAFQPMGDSSCPADRRIKVPAVSLHSGWPLHLHHGLAHCFYPPGHFEDRYRRRLDAEPNDRRQTTTTTTTTTTPTPKTTTTTATATKTLLSIRD